ncbi:unnamed protein product [Nezara viridula]|uniref:Kynurenine 3-monooxygenase n=1 Tax=Nezara viridula TaxID=85310 RepID=A0A9P0MPC4_NEZVI|nr:unnamed protein product [Nezara viridula]
MKVLIVGGGLVGSLCACYFGLRGHEVHIYDFRNDPRTEKLSKGRSINLALSTRGIEALSRVGVEGVILEHGIPMKGRMIHSKSGEKKSIPYDPVYKKCIYSVGRKHLNELLITEAEKYQNVHLHFNHKITSVNFEEKKIFFKSADNNNSELKEDKGDLIVGADGAFSIVRREMMKQPMFNFSQTYIEHGYRELTIPPANNFKMESNHLHIWPRGEFMLIALPNQDDSWTVTLFMPLVKFDELQGKEHAIKSFFQQNFPDALQLIGDSKVIEDFSKPSHLVSIKCTKYNVGNKAVILGDSAHAMVPFYGQGMNAGFEDCRILDEFIHSEGLDLEEALELFSITRAKNAEAICNLSMYNYSEMRQLVTQTSYILRKKLDNILYWLFSSKWIPLYQSITFTNIPYSECLQNRKRQNVILRNVFYVLLCASVTPISWYIFRWKQSL